MPWDRIHKTALRPEWAPEPQRTNIGPFCTAMRSSSKNGICGRVCGDDERMRSQAIILKLSIPTWVYGACAYVLLLPLLLLAAAVVWAYKVSGVLYLCRDSLGIFDFIPPFVHPNHDDVYFVAPWKVYALWFALLAFVLLAPIVASWLLSRHWREDENL